MRTAVRNGVALRYVRADGDRVPVILVHGWCCDHTFFQPQFDALAHRGHTVVAVDLRGHGSSDSPDQAYPISAFSDDLAWLAAELDLEKPIVVGHSMGGVAAFDLAVRHPGLASAVVMIDSPVTRPPASRAKMPAFIQTLKDGDHRTAITGYVEQALFLPTDDKARCAAILDRMLRTQRHVMVAALQGLYDFDPGQAAGRPLPPALFIAANARPLSEIPRLLDLAPQTQFGQTVGSGHFCPLEVPDQINAMLARFVRNIGLAGDDRS